MSHIKLNIALSPWFLVIRRRRDDSVLGCLIQERENVWRLRMGERVWQCGAKIDALRIANALEAADDERRTCPICDDGACETKSLECGS